MFKRIAWKVAWLLRCRSSKPRNPISKWATDYIWNNSAWETEEYT